MTLQEYTQAGQGNTFTAWLENRLDQLGSIRGSSAFKFGIYSRKDKTPKDGSASDSYTRDYAWYTKYGATPEEAFTQVKSLVVRGAEAAARADYAAIDSIDLGEAYKWKIAFHYQDQENPGVIAVWFGDGTDFAGCDTLPEVRNRNRRKREDGKDTYGPSAVHCLKNLVQQGDLILVSQGNSRFRAIAEVTGPYSFEPRSVARRMEITTPTLSSGT